jgi:C1A family cysteine protease
MMGEEMSNSEISGFGGRPLQTLTAPPTPGAAPSVAVQADSVRRLRDLGLEDCEQLIAAAAVKDISEELQKMLELNKQGFKSLLESARSGLPEDRAELFGSPAPSDLGRGLKAPSEAIGAEAQRMARAPAVSTVEAGAFPEAVDLIRYMPPIRHQGGRPTCAAFALTALNEYFRRWHGVEVDLADGHLYYEVKLIDGDPTGCGTWLAKAVMALRDRGQCHESIWPYDPTLPCDNQGELPPTARSDGLNYRLQTFAVEERSVVAYQAQLAQARPIAVSIPTYESWYQSKEVRRSGRITMRIGAETPAEGHALVVVGYQNSESSPGGGFFMVRNSWGLGWASESPYGPGYGTIPYQYITDDAWEAYSTRLDGPPPVEEPTGAIVRIKVGSNVEITIEDVISDNGPGRVSRVSRGGKSGPRPMRVSRAAPLEDESEA